VRLGARGAAPVADSRPTNTGVPREVLEQVRRIELRTRGLVDSIFGGEYRSVFRGQGMEVAEVREYEAGDDVRNIEGKNFLREEILLRINALLVSGRANRIFFTEFVVQ